MFKKLFNLFSGKKSAEKHDATTEPASETLEKDGAGETTGAEITDAEENESMEKVISGTDYNTLQRKLVEVLEKSFSGYSVECDVPAGRFDTSAHEKAKPISILVSKDEKPVLAIAIVANNTYRSMPVVGTKNIIDNANIPYIRFFQELGFDEEYATGRFSEYL